MITEFIKKLLGITQDKEEDKKASVPFMVTRDMKQQLFDLGYPRSIVIKMSAVKAAALIAEGRTYNVR